jgi:hypothetical protein
MPARGKGRKGMWRGFQAARKIVAKDDTGGEEMPAREEGCGEGEKYGGK